MKYMFKTDDISGKSVYVDDDVNRFALDIANTIRQAKQPLKFQIGIFEDTSSISSAV